MSGDITLYWGSGSYPCWRVMIVLEEKELPYTSKLMSFEKKEHKSEEVIKLNPRGQFPTLVIGDIVIGESLAACEYLEAVYKDKGTSLLPPASSPKELALVMQRMHESCNLQQKAITDIVYYNWRTKNPDQELLDKRYKELADELTRWEGYLSDHKNENTFLAGPNITLADAVFFPYVAFGVRMGLKLDGRYPCLATYYDQLKERSSLKKTWPPHWNTSPGSTLLADV